LKVSDIVSYAFDAIRLRKLRTGLTTLGVVIGIAAIVALLSITQGLQITIASQLQSGFATDTIIVTAGGGFGMAGGGSGSDSDFTLYVNYTQLIDDIDEVDTSVAVIQRTCTINASGQELRLTVVGVDFPKYANIYSATFKTESGSIPVEPNDNSVVIGKRVNDPWENGTIFSNVDDLIEIMWLNASILPPKNEMYTGQVTAVLEEIGGFSFTGPSDQRLYIPISQAQNFFGTEECSVIIVQLENDDEATIDRVSDVIDDIFSDQVSVSSSTAMLNTVTSIFSSIELFLGGIAAISLVVAGVGIMNIMIVSLMERTREIGILKAVGMKSRTVLSIFLSEAIIVGVMGTTLGIVTGWGLANIVVRVLSRGSFGPGGNQSAVTNGMTIIPVITPTVLIGAFTFGLIISIIFALYPSWRASRLKPVEALRYE
jgi:putative ABC transport system permease protein